MKREFITVDIDDVIADSTEAFRTAVNQHTSANLTPDDYRTPYTSYNRYYEHVWQKHGLKVSYDEVSAPMLVDQSHVPLVEGADEALRVLHKWYDLATITQRPENWELATVEYLGNKLTGLALEVHFVKKRPGVTKGQICKELGVSWHIDDNPDYCQTVLDEGIGAILFGEYGWHHTVPEGAIACRNWGEVVEFFRDQQ